METNSGVTVGTGLKFMKPTRRTYFLKEDGSGPVTWEIGDIERYNRFKKNNKKAIKLQLEEAHLHIFQTAMQYITAFQNSVNYMVFPPLLSEANLQAFLSGSDDFESEADATSLTLNLAIALGARAMNDEDTMKEYWHKAREYAGYVFDNSNYTIATALHIMGMEYLFMQGDRNRGNSYLYLAQKMCERLGMLNSDVYLRYCTLDLCIKMHSMNFEDFHRAREKLAQARALPTADAMFPLALQYTPANTTLTTTTPFTQPRTQPSPPPTTTPTVATSNSLSQLQAMVASSQQPRMQHPALSSVVPPQQAQSSQATHTQLPQRHTVQAHPPMQQQPHSQSHHPSQRQQQQQQPQQQQPRPPGVIVEVSPEEPPAVPQWSQEDYRNYQRAHMLIAQSAINVAACAILRRQQEELYEEYTEDADELAEYLERRKRMVEHIIIYMPRFEEEFELQCEGTPKTFPYSFRMFLYAMVADAFWSLGYVEHAHDYALRYLRYAQQPPFKQIYSSVPYLAVLVLKVFLGRQNFVLMERMLSTLRGVQDKFPNLPALLEPYEQALRARDSTVKIETKLHEMWD